MFGSTRISLDNQHLVSVSPTFKRIPVQESPASLFLKIRDHYPYTFLLESLEGPRKEARYSFIGFQPRLILTAKNGRAYLRDTRAESSIQFVTDNPLLILRDLIRPFKPEADKHRFCGGAVGYLSYDIIRYWETLPRDTTDAYEFPDLEMGLYDDGIIVDHTKKETVYFFRAENRLPELQEIMRQPSPSTSLSCSPPSTNIPQPSYHEMIKSIKQNVLAGDIFQTVLSRRYEFKVEGDLGHFYHALRLINPSPYMYYLKMEDRQIIGSSPEMLARVSGSHIETYPIAGTRPFVADPRENKRLAKELLADPKERAEHIMLVDLARNDLGRVAQFGSVKVPKFMEVNQYSHVQHIVSQVIAEIADDKDCFDVLQAVFPAGTVSGAPKIRAMEIIEENEPTRRGPYAGAVGYFAYNGNMDFAITIRTLIARGNQGYIQAGGGIVADSDPQLEWQETQHKARALLKALEQIGGV